MWLIHLYSCVACLLCTLPVPTLTCHTFKNIFVTAKDINQTEFNETINGCLERVRFEGRQPVKELYIRNQEIGELGPGSVKYLVKLKTVSFWGNKINSISPGAFKGVPRLKYVQISYSNIKEIPRNVFNAIPQMELLRIHNNEIDIVEDLAFANLTFLKRIYVDSNKLEYWNREWFTNSTALEIMDFQANQIRTIPRRAFASLTKLKQIFFDFNEISVVQADAFLGITKLEYLGLRYNRLTEIKEDIFPNNLSIRTFMIDANYLNFLEDNVLKKVSVKDISIDNNPWKCPCLDRIKFWLYTTNGTMSISSECTGSNVPVCAYSLSFSQTCLENVDRELTERYLSNLKTLKPPLSGNCARLD